MFCIKLIYVEDVVKIEAYIHENTMKVYFTYNINSFLFYFLINLIISPIFEL